MTISGSSTCRQFAAGSKFTLDRHFNGNGHYVLTSVYHHATVGEAYTTGTDCRNPVHEYLSLHPVRSAVQTGTNHPAADRRGDPDRGRGRPVRPGNLHRQIRPRESPVPLGPQRNERRQQLLLGSGRNAPGPASSGGSSISLGSARRSSSISRRRPRPADHHRQRLQRRKHAPVHAAR